MSEVREVLISYVINDRMKDYPRLVDSLIDEFLDNIRDYDYLLEDELRQYGEEYQEEEEQEEEYQEEEEQEEGEMDVFDLQVERSLKIFFLVPPEFNNFTTDSYDDVVQEWQRHTDIIRKIRLAYIQDNQLQRIP